MHAAYSPFMRHSTRVPGSLAFAFGAKGWRAAALAVFLCIAGMLHGCGSLPPNTGRVESHALPPDPASALVQLTQTLKNQAHTPHETGFVLLESPDSAYASRLALAQQATHTLDLQYYAIHADPSTRTLLHAIRAAAGRGVRVRILLDDFNTTGADAQVMQLAFVPNIEMRLFNPLSGGRDLGGLRVLWALQDFARLQRRMHNKLFLADNVMGIVGGRNLGQAYFGQANGSNFADVDVLAAGALVPQMSDNFDRYWNHALAYPVQTLTSRRALQVLHEQSPPGVARGASPPPGTAQQQPDTSAAAALPPAMHLAQANWVWAPSALLAEQPTKFDADGPPSNAPTVVSGLLSLMQNTRTDLLVVSPYFVPGPQLMAVFAQLRQRGVRVRILTNSLASNDAPLTHIGYARWRKPLLQLGVELYEMHARQRRSLRSAFGSSGKARNASLHAKVVVLDGHVLGVGSMNLDLRSQLSNSEVALLIGSHVMAQAMIEQIEEVLESAAWQVTLDANGRLQWHTPDSSHPPHTAAEPNASVPLQLLLKMATPFAPDELL